MQNRATYRLFLLTVSVIWGFAACGENGIPSGHPNATEATGQRVSTARAAADRCSAIEAAYQRALSDAQRCISSGTPFPQCNTPVAASLRCGCLTLVNVAVPLLDQRAAAWQGQGCHLADYSCPTSCPALGSASCERGRCIAR